MPWAKIVAWTVIGLIFVGLLDASIPTDQGQAWGRVLALPVLMTGYVLWSHWRRNN